MKKAKKRKKRPAKLVRYVGSPTWRGMLKRAAAYRQKRS